MKYGKYKNENDYLKAEKMYATKFHNALKANDITSVKSLGQEIIQALPYTYRDIFDEVIRDTDSELAKKLQPMDYVAFMHGPKEEKMADKFIHRNKIEGYKPHRALQRDFSLVAKPYLTERGIPFDTSNYQNGGIFRAGDNDFWFDSDEQGFFTNHPDFKDTPYNGIKDLLEAVLGSGSDNKTTGKKFNPLTDYINDLYSPSSDEEKRKLETAQKEADDYFNHVAKTDDSIPGYENTSIDAGVLSGMLTDSPEIRKATLAWMNNLPEIDANAIKRVIASKEFRDMYGDLDFDWKGNKNYHEPETDPDYAPHTDATSEIYDEGFNKFMDEQRGNTDLSSIAKAITANDLGRSL